MDVTSAEAAKNGNAIRPGRPIRTASTVVTPIPERRWRGSRCHADGTLAGVPTGPLVVRSDGSADPGRSSAPGDWTLRITPRDLSWIRVDHQTRLQVEDVEIVIAGRFELHRDGTHFELDAAERDGLGPVLALYPTTLTAASIDPDGTLRLAFDNGGVIAVPPDADYEPWQIAGPATALVVCTPGIPGVLAVWS
jgi:hypothetical protein